MITALALWSCASSSPKDDAPADSGTPPTTDSTAPPPTDTADTPIVTTTQGEIDGSCAVDPDNALRATCTFERSPAGRVEVELTDGTETVVFADEAEVTSHSVPLWGLTADATWSWVARAGGDEASGSFVTGSLPAEVAIDFSPSVTGDSTVPMVLLPASCDVDGYAVVTDLQGRVRWYQDAMEPGAGTTERLMALQLGDDDTISALAGEVQLVRFDLAGHELLRLEPGKPVHHDVFRRDGVTYVFLAEDYTDSSGRLWVEDVVAGYDDAGALVTSWAEHDHLDTASAPQGPSLFWDDVYPGSTDAWHSNGLYVTDTGGLLISLNRIRSIILVEGGEIAWWLTGDGVGHPFPSDFTPVDGAGSATFYDAHHPALLDDGHLTVFDNSRTRGLELALDEAAGTATFVGEYPLTGVDCPIQGSHFVTDDGHHLVACGSDHLIVEFDSAGAEVARMVPSCASGDDPPLTVRAQPVDLWEAAVGDVRAHRP